MNQQGTMLAHTLSGVGPFNRGTSGGGVESTGLVVEDVRGRHFELRIGEKDVG